MPTPYWPDTGKAHTTCTGLLVVFVAVSVAFRFTRIFSSAAEGSAGMASLLSPEKDTVCSLAIK